MFLIIFAIVLVISAGALFLVTKKPQLKTAAQIVLGAITVVLVVLLINSIRQPIKFKKERIKRENAAIAKLKDIRTIQVAYKEKYGSYTDSFDTLINFVKHDSFDMATIDQVGVWDQDEMSLEEALKEGIITKTINKMAVMDSLFPNGYPIDDLSIVPYGHRTKFSMATGVVQTRSKIRVKVFEAYVYYDDLLKGLNRQLVINYKDERTQITNFDGLKVGSLREANNNSGNWEK